jgi:hypothetical protein
MKITQKTVPQRINHLPAVDDFSLLPPAKDVCQKCAVKHDDAMPHNQQSIYWQYWFYSQYGRWPTWADAMSHCTLEMKLAWTKALAEQGITV